MAGEEVGPRRFGAEYASDPASPVTNALQPTAPEVYGERPSGYSFPGFLSFDRQFDQEYPDAGPYLSGLATRLVGSLQMVFGKPGTPGSYHPSAQAYDYGQFLRDLAVAATIEKNQAAGKANPTISGEGRSDKKTVTPNRSQQNVT